MSGKLRLTAFLMVFAILVCRIGIVNVNAAEGVKSENASTQLTGLRITDLDKPVAGKTLDLKARIRTSENVTWEIPVIWIDDLGNTVYEAVPGRKYYPSFVFYLPMGYSINTNAPGEQLGVKLPDFLVELFGSSVAFIGDAEKGITYITYIPSYVAATVSRSSETSQAAPAGIVTNPRTDIGIAQPASEKDPYSDEHHSDDEVKKESVISSGSGSSYNNVIPYDPYRQVRIHCSEEVIEKMGVEALNELITIVKNKLEPQAVNLLSNSFEAYKSNPSALGKQIGLYVYYKSGSVDNGNGTTDPTPAGALAYVSGGYINNVGGEDIYKYVIGLDTDTFMVQDPNTGNWQIKESEKDNLDNTIVHEMMHAFMDDYTRRGMCDSNDGFPFWFMEGIASTVENVYQYRSYLFQTLGEVKTGNEVKYKFDKDDKNRYLPVDPETDYRIPYSDSSILNKYTDGSLKDSYRYDLSLSHEVENTGSAYVAGYLAVVYLGYLTALHEGRDNIVIAPDYEEGIYPHINIDAIRYGTSRILEMLHEGRSLDSIISDISSRPGENNGSYYVSTNEFQTAFIKGTGEESNTRTIRTAQNGTSENVLGSLAFCNYLLNFLEDNSYKEGDCTALATGSILSADQHINSPLDWTKNASSDLYKILDTNGYVASTVSDEVAFDNTGGTSTSHANDASDNNDSGQGAAVAAAAKPIEVINADEAAPAVESDTASTDAPVSDTVTVDTDATVAAETEAAVPDVETPGASADDAIADTTAVDTAVPDAAAPVDVTADAEIPGVEPDASVYDPGILPEELVPEGEPCTILPHEEDAIVPEYDEPVAQPSDEPDGDGGDGGNDGDTSSSDDSSDDGSDDSSDSVSDSGDESSSDDSAAE